MSRRRTTVAVVSMAVAIGLCALWGRSYSGADGVGYSSYELTADGAMRDLRMSGMSSWRGTVSVDHYSMSGDPWRGGAGWAPPARGWSVEWGTQVVGSVATPEVLGFRFVRERDVRAAPGVLVSRSSYGLPYWLLVGVAGVPAAREVWRRGVVRRERRRCEGGLCGGCGYDLRGSGGRCSECGREVGV